MANQLQLNFFTMNRREVLSRLAVIFGTATLSPDTLLATAARVSDPDYDPAAPPAIGLFSKKQIKILDEMADVILPRTSTPGAKDAKTVGAFMARYISDCKEDRDQKIALGGLDILDAECKKRFGKRFMRCTREQQTAYFKDLDAEQRAYTKAKKSEEPPHWFRIFWELALFGFFTSEIGSTQALRWVMVPGRYETIDYKKGDHAWGG